MLCFFFPRNSNCIYPRNINENILFLNMQCASLHHQMLNKIHRCFAMKCLQCFYPAASLF
nr:hypothetical protein Iba_chr15bCG0970 [Ipomoea batatas]GMD98173.1 hypothetical protein Iba_chr15dCG0170 [Ipomoea batatas]GMD99076.1 hypothetical protein Iba_chr15eCG0310 [Ipomoea batatas]